MTTNTIIKWTGIVTLLLVFSRITGFLRETAIAYQFGASADTDAYLIASMLPQILFVAFSDAVKTAFIPVYGEYHNQKDGGVFVLTAYVLLGALMLALSLVLVAAAPLLVRLVAPGFSGETYEITVRMSRILLPGLFFMGLTGLSSGVLHTKKNFIVPALPAYPSNLIIIAAAVYWGGRYGIMGLTWATLIAFASQFLIQLPSLIRLGVFKKSALAWSHPGIKKMAVMLPPVVLGGAALEIKSVVDRMFGSLLPEGSIAALNFASRIFFLPNGILIMALLTVLYPTLVDLKMEERMDEFRETLRQGLGMVVLLVTPMMVGLLVLRQPVVKLLFERGAFDAAATESTAFALAFYSLGLVAMGLQLLLTRAFYALRDTVTPMVVTFLMVGLNVLFNWLLIGPLQQGGIALGTSLAFIISIALLWVPLRRKIGPFGGHRLLDTLWKSSAAALVMGIALLYGREFLVSSGVGLAVRLGGLIGAATLLYFSLAMLLKVGEMEAGVGVLRKMLLRRRAV